MGLLRATVRAVVEHSRNATEVVSAAAVEDSHASPLHGIPKWLLVLLALACLFLAACASGMTLGYMSLDTIGLEIVSNGTNVSEAAAAAVILPVRKQGNLLLCTLLLTNTLATELLPLVLEALYPGATICHSFCARLPHALGSLLTASRHSCAFSVNVPRWPFCAYYKCSVPNNLL